MKNNNTLLKRKEKFTRTTSVYAVSGEDFLHGKTDRQWLEGVLAGGAKIVQLRDKKSPDRVLLEKARVFRRLTLEADALFLVNDRPDIALLSGADGIHVGNDDLLPEDIHSLAPDLLIGVSCNTLEQARSLGQMVRKGKSAAAYFNIGPLFATQTKKEARLPLGPGAIAEFSALCPLPFTVMGGIKLHHVPALMAAGARRIAVVTALAMAPDITGATRQWMEAMGH